MRLSLKCEGVTPLFMEGDKKAELRTSEIKGMMRFWWRAIRAENDIKTLRKEEAEIFGGTGKGEGRSKISIKVECDGDEFKIVDELKVEEEAIRYLWYTTILPGRKKEYIEPEKSSFTITINSFDERAFKNAVGSLWAAIYLGGFGMRSRRGAGCLRVVEYSFDECADKEGFPDFDINGFKSSPADFIKTNFEKAVKLINDEGYIKDFCYPYSNLSFSRFIISQRDFKNWKKAVNEIGSVYLKFRKKHRDDLFGPGAFGLPVVHHRGSLISTLSLRRASPIIIKVLKWDNKFYWMVLRLTGEFLPEGKMLRFNFSTNNFMTQKPDYSLIDKFWNELKRKGEEHILSIPQVLKDVVNKIVNVLEPDEIFLFGSKARGDFHKKSDIDIAVKTDKPLAKLDVDLNWDIVSFKSIEDKFAQKIKWEGVKIYERKTT